MSRPFTILSPAEQEIHDEHPKLNAERRKYSFYQSHDLKSLLKDVRGANNKVYFAVCYGYFKETAQFYETANPQDIAYVAKQLGIEDPNIQWENYGRIAKENHRKTILEFFSFSPFDEKAVAIVKVETIKSLRSRKSPKTCFREIVDLLKHVRIEIPPYKKLATLIGTSYNHHRTELLEVVAQHLTSEARRKLDELTEKPNQDSLASDAYALTLAKRFTHSIKPAKVRKNVALHAKLLEIFELVKPIIEKLNLNSEGIRSFAAIAEYSQIFQVKRKKDDDRYLHLIVFVANQLFRLQDVLVETFLRVVKSLINQATKEAKEEYFKNRTELEGLTTELATSTENVVERLNKVASILTSPELTDSEKVQKALGVLFSHETKIGELKERIAKLQSASKNLTGDSILMRILCEKSKVLEGRCKDIVLGLTFDFEGSDRNIGAAIKHYIEMNGRLEGESCPKGFLKANEKKNLEGQTPFNVPLYKVYFFQRIAEALKSGALSLVNAYEYTTLESNLISRDRFKANRQQILDQAELSRFGNIQKLIEVFRLETNALFKQVNIAVSRGQNPYVVPDGNGGYHLSPERNTAATIEWEDTKLELYPKDKPISLAQAIATVNKATRFTEAFEHILHKNIKLRPEDKIFYAGIMSFGCHFGPRNLAKHSDDINVNTLETTADTYFSVENIRNACDRIMEFVDQLPVANLFRSEQAVHTSSDGQKWIVSYDSLNANFSFKYGGKDLVLSDYAYVDCRNLFFHSDVYSGAVREAHYMLDGILRNTVVKSKMHSTDTHGYTDAVFCLAHLLGITFAPRLAKVKKRLLFSFEPRREYKNLGYIVLPEKEINTTWIEDHYEDILRVAASIKLGETTASQVFKRLNSYTEDNPLYKAIKEFGKILRTKHILTYLDNGDYRSAIQKQLNKSELGNKMDRAIAVGNPEYSEVWKDSQEVTGSCRRLIKNVIVCWNYMHLSQLLIDAKDEKKKRMIIKRILETSTASWSHFLINGKFEFSPNHLRDSRNFKIEKMFDPSIVIVKDEPTDLRT